LSAQDKRASSVDRRKTLPYHGKYVQFLPLHAIAMERYCRRMTSVRPSVRLSVTLVTADHIR